MKNILMITILSLFIFGCGSNVSPRYYQVQLYDHSGGVIQEWVAVGHIRNTDSTIYFREKTTGKRVEISGIITVQEL